MEIKDSRIDAGKAFDWGRTSKEYARYRDIYLEEFNVLHYAAIAVLRKVSNIPSSGSSGTDSLPE